MAEAHQRGLQLFAESQYEAAIRCFEESLRQAETSEVWNDWATAQFASGHAEAAMTGLRRALRLDSQNAQAAENLRALNSLAASPLSWPGSSHEFATPNGSAAPPSTRATENEQTAVEDNRAIYELLRDFQAIPAEDPSLAPAVIAAMRTMRLYSGYFVERCLARLARLPAKALPTALKVLEKCAEADYRFSIILGWWHMQAGDYDTALRHLRFACDDSASDLFAENALIACSRRQAVRTGSHSGFEGLEEYLAASFCDVPWRHLEIYQGGNASLCCFGWLPLPVGNPRAQSLEEIWNSDFAIAIRQSILDGSFRFCSKIHCQYIAGRSLPRRMSPNSPGTKLDSTKMPQRWVEVNPAKFPARLTHPPRTLRLCYDRTCNLACPQCRNDYYLATREEQERMDREFLPFMLEVARNAETVGLNGSGEVFASKHARHFLSRLRREQFPQLKFWFVSNGQLFNEKVFREFDLYGRIQWIQISMDAARPGTYRIVRRGGNFQRLLSNLAFLSSLKTSRGEKFRLEICFIVSSMNFRDMPEFVQLGKRFHVDSILFNLIRNWGHLSLTKFEELNVANPSHPEHQEFLRVMQSPELSDPIVDCGSVAPYRRGEAGQEG